MENNIFLLIGVKCLNMNNIETNGIFSNVFFWVTVVNKYLHCTRSGENATTETRRHDLARTQQQKTWKTTSDTILADRSGGKNCP